MDWTMWLALVLVATTQPPDLVILDLGLPGVDGQDVLRRLREWLTAPILVLSARNQEKQKIEADSAQPRYILTEQGIGYRFAGD